MENQINVYEAIAESDVAIFWEQLRAYFERDILPDPEDEDREYFLDGTEYRENIQKLHERPQDRCHYLFFHRDGQEIGFAMPVIYTTEDGKCFILEFCVYPEFRGSGTGKECVRALLDWAAENGALYAELNYGGDNRRLRFWENVGFIKNGADEWGEPLLALPPKEDIPITVEALNDPDEWQLKKLINGYLLELGRQPLEEEQQQRLQQAIRDGKITFLIAKRGYRVVGMYTFHGVHGESVFCKGNGAISYVEPIFRKQGIAQKLAQAAQDTKI